MFEHRDLTRFIWIFLCVISIIIPGPIIPAINFIIATAALIYKVKKAKESPESFNIFIIEIIMLAIVMLISISFCVMRISVEHSYSKNNNLENGTTYSSSDIAKALIVKYKNEHQSQFNNNANILSIKKGFKSHIEKELDTTNVGGNGNQVICYIGMDRVTFTITQNDITYEIQQTNEFELMN